MQTRKQGLFFWYSLTLGSSVLCIIVLRALNVGVTYDEAWTLTGFVPFSYADILSYTPCDANNHLLNTLLIRLLYGIFPNTLFVARLPNVLAGLLFIVFAYKLSRSYNGQLRYFAFSFLICNPFLFEFFSLARGYGLAMGFMVMALYFIVNYASKRKSKTVIYSALCLLLVSASMLSSLHFVLPAYGLLGVLILQQKENRTKNSTLLIIVLLSNILLLVLPIIKLRENTSFYYGGTTNFFSDTLVSLGKYFVGSTIADGGIVLGVAVASLVMLAILIRHLFNYKKDSLNSYLFSALLLLSVGSVLLQFYLLGTRFVIDRTGMFFYPLFAMAAAEGLASMTNTKVKGLALTGLSVVLLLNLLLRLNFYKTQVWYFDAHSEEIVQTLKEKTEGKVCSLQFSWPLRKSLEYYRDGQFKNLRLAYKSPQVAATDGDYVLFLASGIDQVDYNYGYDILNLYPKDTVLSFKEEKLYLFKLKPQH